MCGGWPGRCYFLFVRALRRRTRRYSTTTPAVTDRAFARSAPAGVVADLGRSTRNKMAMVFAMSVSLQPTVKGGVAVLPAMRLRERMHFPVEAALAFCAGGYSRVVIGDVFSNLYQR